MTHTAPLDPAIGGWTGFAFSTRRRFLQGAASTATVLAASSHARVFGAADKVRLGLIGCGSRGRHVLSLFQLDPSVEVVGLCDVFEEQTLAVKKGAPAAEGRTDHRKLLERKDLDAVLIATPDHWHAPVCIDALNAGKHAYCEKPLTLKIEEGPEIVKAARINNRVCQVGMQQRSGKHYLAAKREIVDAGKLGKVTLARTWWHGNTYHLRRAPESLQRKPSTLDWGRFLGPVRWREYDPQQYFNWRAYLDFGWREALRSAVPQKPQAIPRLNLAG